MQSIKLRRRLATLAATALTASLVFTGAIPSLAFHEVQITGAEDLVTTEAGGTDSFDVVLGESPMGETVTITVTSLNVFEVVVDKATLTFTDADWNIAQTVTVTGIDDEVTDGDVVVTIQLAWSSNNEIFTGGTNISVTNTDNEVAGITLSQTTGLATSEAETTDTFTVVLDAEPTGSVSVTVASSDTTEATVSPTTLEFDDTNWASAQTVTVTGVDDDVVDGAQPYAINLSASGGGYIEVTAQVTGSNADNDVAAPPAGNDPAATDDETTGFTDIGTLNAETIAAIESLVELSITQGTSDTTFSPSEVVSRWQMALFLTRQLEVHGVTLPTATDQGFDDLSGLSVETQTAIAQLAMLAVTNGTSDTTYSPADGVNRWQMALFMTRVLTAAGVDLPTGAGEDFNDIAGLSPEAQLAIRQLSELGVVFGVGDDRFDPSGPVARWQMALFIVRTLEAAGGEIA